MLENTKKKFNSKKKSSTSPEKVSNGRQTSSTLSKLLRTQTPTTVISVFMLATAALTTLLLAIFPVFDPIFSS
ncbi:hypothetical protein GCK72_017996 [Caenorhabditis remanei]|uniref:Uncharacterized protein n=1 Tax=Caenorhabditis remanei TaxID=31234 RepID=A0A6A5GA83_CAERE|nr:hypothetical protein GCK72_017996 [Caenorhabditis remanei]KAF1751442.1 hypothetical protein GCK72_017996 [Caenorhabditis remanei]